MRKIYVLYAAVIIFLLMVVSTSSASMLGPAPGIYDRLPQGSTLKKFINIVTQTYAPTHSSLSPEASTVSGDNTPSEGNHIDEGNTEGTPTIDQGDGPATNTIDENGIEGTTMPTIDPEGHMGIILLERAINNVVEQNGNVGTTLHQMVERIYAPGTTAGSDNAVAIIENTVVVGSGGPSISNHQSVVVATNH
jgi:hypothetical protein